MLVDVDDLVMVVVAVPSGDNNVFGIDVQKSRSSSSWSIV